MPATEREEFASLHLGTLSPVFSLEDFTDSHYWAVVACQCGPDDNTAKGEIDRVMSSLRLASTGAVGARLGIAKHARPEYRFSGAHSTKEYNTYSLPRGLFPFHLRDYSIDGAYSEALAVYRELGKKNVYEQMRNAIARFNYSYQRERAEDAIVDLATSLESTLLGDSDSDKAYRLGIRAGQLLRHREIGAEKAYKMVAGINNLRNKVIHANKALAELGRGEFMGIDKDSPRTSAQQVVREVLREYIRRIGAGSSLKDVNRTLDECARGCRES
jgi:hypothetical protein